MARKGVNLLEGDDEEREGDSEEDSGDDGGSYERRRGGFVDVLMVILFVCVMLGGVAWAGYQFWWLPKAKKEAQLKKERMKQEQQRKMRLAKMRAAIKRAQQTPGQLSQTAGAPAQQRTKGAMERNTQHERPAPSRPTEAKAMRQKPMPRHPAEKAPLAASTATQKPAAPPRMEGKPGGETATVIQTPEKKAPASKTRPARPSLGEKQKRVAEKKPEAPKAKVRSRASGRKPPQGFFYSVQVASCSTERCADSFSKRLRSKGFSAFRMASTSRVRRRGGQITEVLLGSFSSPAKARALARRAREKKIGARVYRSNNQWKVAAGSFRNLEDAALLLDRAEDSGFRGELASRLQSEGRRRLYRIQTGKFEGFREALAFRKKIRLAGFSDAIVVRRRSRK